MVREFQQVAAVAATKSLALFLALCGLFYTGYSNAAVLAEERFDTLYHNYDGGGVEIDGPSILVRKNIGSTVSLSANYYVDSISSASVDVITQASPYTEERTQKSLGVDYLYDKSIMSYTFTTSTENDYDAKTNNFNISQEIFGGLTTVSMGYSVGKNIISKSTDNTFLKNASTKGYRLSMSQVLTKDMLMGLTYEIITDEGFLNNPYRQIRYSDSINTYALQPEIYPETRTSNAASISLRYYLDYRASVYGGYRFFSDTWNITANTFDLGYVHPYEEKWLIETNLRLYSQTKASFFSNLFPYVNAQDYLGSDKELSTFSSNSFGIGMTYKIGKDSLAFFEKGTFNFYIDHFIYDYEDFLNTTVSAAIPGTEPNYKFSANVIRLYMSFWF